MLNFYLIRHGAKEAITPDPPLTAIGVSQAEVTAKFLQNVSFKEIVSSPRLRAKQTAKIIADNQKTNVSIDNRLIERLEWEPDETFSQFLDEWNKTDIDRDYQPRKGNSSSTNGKRLGNFLNELSANHKEGNILIVTHGGSIGDLLRYLFSEQDLEHKTEANSGAKYIDVSECSITKIQKDDEGYKLLSINDISHLSIPLI